MRLYAILVTLFGILSTCCGGTLNVRVAEPTPQFVEGLQDNTVALVWYLNEDGEEVPDGTKMSFCAGVFVGEREILTAYHCIDHVKGPHVLADPLAEMLGVEESDPLDGELKINRHGDNSDIVATVKKYDKENDLALLVVPIGHAFSPVAKMSFVGEEIHVVGMPGHSDWAYQHGWIANFKGVQSPNSDGPVPMMQVQAPIYYGNSGGPAFNNHGEVLGICSMRNTQAPDVGYFVPISSISRFLASAR